MFASIAPIKNILPVLAVGVVESQALELALPPSLLFATGIGLFLGALSRGASLRKVRRPWKEIADDLVVSLLAAGANASLALFISDYWQLQPLYALCVATAIGHQGTDGIEWAVETFNRRIKKITGKEDNND